MRLNLVDLGPSHFFVLRVRLDSTWFDHEAWCHCVQYCTVRYCTVDHRSRPSHYDLAQLKVLRAKGWPKIIS